MVSKNVKLLSRYCFIFSQRSKNYIINRFSWYVKSAILDMGANPKICMEKPCCLDHLTTDLCLISGGWLLVSNIVMQSSSPPSQLPVNTSYRAISSDQMILTKDAMKELRKYLSFTQLRFHCSKHHGRTFHVTTADNSTGKAVVRYFSDQTDAFPDSCGSFVRMENDNSKLASVCEKWGRENRKYNVGKWGHNHKDQNRLYDHPAFVGGQYHWLLHLHSHNSRWECDDFRQGVSSGDFWKVFVR